MASLESQATDSRPESNSPPRSWYPLPQQNHDELLTIPSFSPHETCNSRSQGSDLAGSARALIESSTQTSPGATFKPNVMPLSRLDSDASKTDESLEDFITSSPIVSLASFPSAATCVKCIPADALTGQTPSNRDSEVPTRILEFEHLSRRLITTYFVYFLCGWGDGG